MVDYRSERMPSPDGRGIAVGRWRAAWDAYSTAVRPLSKPLSPLVRPFAQGATFDLIGFWYAWHTCGGFDGLHEQLGMSRSAIYRRVSLFRKAFGEHPDVYRFPGVHLDVDEVVAAGAADATRNDT